jgi:cytoskeletal protein CcmA (bactofilin family)
MRDRKGIIFTLLLSVLLLLAWQGPALAQNTGVWPESGATETLWVNGDHFAAGNAVAVKEEIPGDLYAAGSDILIQGGTGGDLLAAGRNIDVGSDIGGSIRAAGAQVTVRGEVGRNATIAGQQLIITPEALITGNAYLGGATVSVAGRVEGDLKAGGSAVVIGGQIDRDVQVSAERVQVLPGAVIGGNLVYASNNPAEISPDAQIRGTVTQIPVAPKKAEPSAGARIWQALLSLIALLVAALVLVLLLPRSLRQVAATVRTQPWLCLGLGFAGLVAPPFLAVILFITVVGLLLGGIVLAGYLAFVAAGFLLGKIVIGLLVGGLILRAVQKQDRASAIWSVLLGAALLKLVSYIPFVGWLITLLAAVLTLGALLYLAGYSWFRKEPQPGEPTQLQPQPEELPQP